MNHEHPTHHSFDRIRKCAAVWAPHMAHDSIRQQDELSSQRRSRAGAMEPTLGSHRVAPRGAPDCYPEWRAGLALQQRIDFDNIWYYAKSCLDGAVNSDDLPEGCAEMWLCRLISMGCPSTEYELIQYGLGVTK